MQSCLYCKESIDGHSTFLIKVEFPLKSGEIEIRDIGVACDRCIIDEGKPLVMHYEHAQEKRDGLNLEPQIKSA